MAKAKKTRVKKYVCPLCGTSGLKSRLGLNKHCYHMHKGITKEDFEAAWVACEAEFMSRTEKAPDASQTSSEPPNATEVSETCGSQQKAHQTPRQTPRQTPPNVKGGGNTRGSKPARSPVKFSTDQSKGLQSVAKAASQPVKPANSVTSAATDVVEPKVVKREPKVAKRLKAVPEPQLDPQSQLHAASIPKGSRLLIDGDIYYQDDTTKPVSFVPVRVERVHMTVGLRQASPDGRTWLFCKVDGIVYGLDERLVLSGEQQLVSLLPPVAVPDVPPRTSSEVEEPPQNVEYRKGRTDFVSAVTAYHTVKQQEADVQKMLKTVREKHYDDIFDFTKAHGSESEKDKQDFVLREGGYRSWLIKIPGRIQTRLNEPAIVQWCVENGHDSVLRRALDPQAWEQLKTTGVVPDSVVKIYEQQTDVPDTFRLSITREMEDGR